MDNTAKISFIPKKPLVRKDFSERKPISLLFTLSFSIFLITSAVYGGMYFYAQALTKEIETQKTELKDIRSRFDLTIIDKAKDLQSRIASARELVDRHLALSPFFDFLATGTLRSVGYDTFQYAQKEGKLEVSLTGKAPSYASLALQRDGFKLETGEKEHFLDFSMNGYKLDQDGNVSFMLKATLNPSLFLYKKGIAAVPSPEADVEGMEESSGAETAPSNNVEGS